MVVARPIVSPVRMVSLRYDPVSMKTIELSSDALLRRQVLGSESNRIAAPLSSVSPNETTRNRN